MKKKLFILIALGVAGAVGSALLNLLISIIPSPAFRNIQTNSSEMKAAHEVLGTKCVMCHMNASNLPYYAAFPIVGGIIEGHVRKGTEIINFQKLFEKEGNNEVSLAKLEQSVKLDSMPITEFMLMHWNGGLSEKEKNTVLKWIHKTRRQNFSTGLASYEFADDSAQPLPGEYHEKLSSLKVELGNKLYHDKRLSGDDTVSCASCHDLKKGGTDQDQFSTGVRDQLGGINAPTSFNSAYNVLQFWDGRAKDLADQAGGPPLNPIEMDSNWKQIIKKLSGDKRLTGMYKKVYGTKDWKAENITNAIAEFEKTLVTPDSPLDLYLKGDSSALGESGKEGYALFKQHGCASCHVGKAMGGQSLEKPVDPDAYYSFRGRTPVEADFGRYNVTKNEKDRYKLKVPILRNIALTHPYLHDGSTMDLKEAVLLMNNYFVAESNRQKLSDKNAGKIVDMLKSNNGKLNGKQL